MKKRALIETGKFDFLMQAFFEFIRKGFFTPKKQPRLISELESELISFKKVFFLLLLWLTQKDYYQKINNIEGVLFLVILFSSSKILKPSLTHHEQGAYFQI